MAMFKIFKDKMDNIRFLLKSDRNQVIFVSKKFSSKSTCLNTIVSLKTESTEKLKFEQFKEKFGGQYYNLKSSLGEFLGTSEIFFSKMAMEKGIQSLKKNAPKASIDYYIYSI